MNTPTGKRHVRVASATAVAGCLALLCVADARTAASGPPQVPFSYRALNDRLPIQRQRSYTVNARIRPLLFWIGRDNIGDARITWRGAPGGRRGFELLIGSDPARAPRQINRWGFIVEELSPLGADVLGIMKESNERTIEAAEAEINRRTNVSAFKAARTTIVGDHAVSATMTVEGSSYLTYHDLDALLALLPPEPRDIQTLTLPAGTQLGFLVAMDSLLQTSIERCRAGSGEDTPPALPFVYGRTMYDLSLLSCHHTPSLEVGTQIFRDVVEGRFEVKNRVTKYETRFHVSYGGSGDLAGLPVRAIFRPRWWMELELVLDAPARPTN